MKVCVTCKVEKDAGDFYNRGGKQKHTTQSSCKLCHTSRSGERVKRMYATDPTFRARMLEKSALSNKVRYATDPAFRARMAASTAQRQKTAESKEWHKNYKNKRYATDTAFRIQMISRGRLSAALKGKGIKPARTMELVGCTAEELIGYLQELIPEGADLKKFHVDHIRPCASFDFSDPEEIRKCFHYTNLQPLTPQANMRKGAKLPTQ